MSDETARMSLPTIRIIDPDIQRCRALANLISGVLEIWNIKHEIAGAEWLEETDADKILDPMQDAESALRIWVEEAPCFQSGEDPEYDKEAWRWAVGQQDTQLGYWDWVRHQKESDAGDN